MKKLILFSFLLLSASLSISAQDTKEITPSSTISDVTVFIKGAQITRNASVNLPAGKSTLRFTNLSPYVDAKSVQVKIEGDVTLHSVNYQLSYDSLDTSGETEKYRKQVELLDESIRQEQTNKLIIEEELAFLKENRKINGNEGIDYSNLKNISAYYSERTSALKMKDLQIDKRINSLLQQRDSLSRKLALTGSQKPEAKGEVVIVLNSKKAGRVPFVISYFTEGAGWNPLYDIRAKNITEPVELIYKANIIQNTKEDWKNIRLKVSSANPNQGNVVPELRTYYLDYYTLPPRYNTESFSGRVRGTIVDEQGEPIIGASIVIKGSTIGTITDFDGKFDLAVPSQQGQLVISFIGMKQLTVPVSGSYMNLVMEEDNVMLEEVVVLAASESMRSQVLEGRVAGVSLGKESKAKKTALPVLQIDNTTSVEFEIKTPYTILSENKPTTVEMESYSLPAEYEYFSIPKIDRDAFLLANVSDWEQYMLLEGEANIFFENTFVGKTILDVRYASDTLNISLGRDKGISIKRDMVKEYTSKKFLGSKAETSRHWKISVKNNKRYPISLTLLDQVPVSTLQEIDVNTEEISGAELNKDSGEVKWRLNLPPAGKQEVDLRYKVKYPKDRNLNVE